MHFFNYEKLVCLPMGSILLSLYSKTTSLFSHQLETHQVDDKTDMLFGTNVKNRLSKHANGIARFFIIIKRFIGFVMKKNYYKSNLIALSF
jgi:hypothetical protein